ncbi:HIT domain-containing protein [Dirofilaria immitis]|nr:HIT domain-containing protein [Dirofilaria immitis]
MATAVRGCAFCSIVHGQRDKHLKTSDNAVVIQDRSPHAPHHYLILSKLHINEANDLTVVDLPSEKGEADTVEDLLRMGFHWSLFISVRHLHMHLLYPTREFGKEKNTDDRMNSNKVKSSPTEMDPNNSPVKDVPDT